ncbi:flagellar biosynthesis protein FlhB [bacterium]|nr:flagellar biosynthesis protein FlhB [bacterium]
MPEDNQQERTETATPKRREEARKKGQVPKSIEINTAILLFVTFLFLNLYGGYFIDKCLYYGRVMFENIGTIYLSTENISGYVSLVLTKTAILIAPIVSIMVGVGLLINFGQVGVYFTHEPMMPKWNKINPLAGFKRVFASKKALVELVKGITKIVVVGYIGYSTVRGVIQDYVILLDKDVYSIFAFIADASFTVGLKISIALLLLSLFDFMFQRYDHEQNIKMTKHEVREELKQMEGDPLIKARVKSIQREMARQRMMGNVPEADVVITNPTKLAIALKYDPKEMSAPTIVAKGARLIAEKIKKMAREYNIPVVENKPLAQALYKSCEVGDEVPEQLFQAVAEILAYIYRLKKKQVA